MTTTKSEVRIGEEFMLNGSVNPAKAGLIISFYQSDTSLLFDRLNYNATTDSSGRFSIKLKLESVGTVYIKACWTGDQDYEGCESNLVVIQCFKRTSSIIISIAKTPIIFNSSQTVSGILDPSIANATIVVTYVKPDGSMFNSTTKTTIDGRFSNVIIVDAVGEWNVVASWTGNDRYEGSISEKIKFLVEKMQPIIVISTPSESITIGESIRISGAITPKIASATVSITYTKPNGDKVTRNVLTDPDGNFQDSYPTDTTGSWKVQASYSGDDVRENAISNTLIITVNPPLVPLIIGLVVVIALATIVCRIWRSKKLGSIKKDNPKLSGMC
ncbi:MAG: Ig-like domain repeat protein [Thaumarchaeota archaeon]|nr:Ig-like domain repeat protein [Nitrososphaerota archaeon]